MKNTTVIRFCSAILFAFLCLPTARAQTPSLPKIDTIPGHVSPFVSAFTDSRSFGKDPFFPKSKRREIQPVLNTNVVLQPGELPQSLAELDMPTRGARETQRFSGIKKTVEDLGGMLKPQTELEQSELRIRLANAGFRSEQAAGIYLGLRFACLISFGAYSVTGRLRCTTAQIAAPRA